jgi:hypothetical protein
MGNRTDYPLPTKAVYGDGLGFNTRTPSVEDLGLITDTGAQWVRLQLSWAEVEAVEGIYDFDNFDALIEACEDGSDWLVRPIITLTHNNPIYYVAPQPLNSSDTNYGVDNADQINAFVDFAATAIDRYKDRGIVWEIWDKPDEDDKWKPEADSTEYMTFLRKVVNSIRGLMPEEYIAGPSVSNIDESGLNFLEECLQDGLLNLVDALTAHMLPDYGSPESNTQKLKALHSKVSQYLKSGKTAPPIFSVSSGFALNMVSANRKPSAYTQCVGTQVDPNKLLYTEDFSNSVWEGYGTKPSVTLGVTDPFSQTRAARFTKTSTVSGVKLPVSHTDTDPIADTYYIASVWLRSTSGTQNIFFGLDDEYKTRVAIDTTWRQYYFVFRVEDTPFLAENWFICYSDQTGKAPWEIALPQVEIPVGPNSDTVDIDDEVDELHLKMIKRVYQNNIINEIPVTCLYELRDNDAATMLKDTKWGMTRADDSERPVYTDWLVPFDSFFPVKLKSYDISENGKTITIIFDTIVDSSSPTVSGFWIYINGIHRDIQKTTLLPDGYTAELELVGKISRYDQIQLTYRSGSLTYSSETPVPNLDIYLSVDNVVKYDRSPLFDPLSWAKYGGDTTLALLYEGTFGNTKLGAVLDTTPPIGNLIINESPGTGGINVHLFDTYTSANSNEGILDYALNAWKFVPSQNETSDRFTCYLKRGNANNNTRVYVKIRRKLSNGDTADHTTSGILLTSNTNFPPAELNDWKKCTFIFDKAYTFLKDIEYWVVFQTDPRADTNQFSRDNEMKIKTLPKTKTGNWWAVANPQDVNNPSVFDPNPTAAISNGFSDNRNRTILYSLTDSLLFTSGQASINELSDGLGKYLSVAAPLGGADDESVFETIGNDEAKMLTKRLMTEDNVSSIVYGVTAGRSKEFALEVLPRPSASNPNPQWVTLSYQLANDQLRHFYKWSFNTPVSLDQVRLRYCGDYYSQVNSGNVTVYAYDELTGVNSIQLSHYPDFRDSYDIPGTSWDGWTPFVDGEFTYSWDLVNQNRLWTNVANIGLDSNDEPIDIKFIQALNDTTAVIMSENAFYVWNNGGLLQGPRRTLASMGFASDVVIRCATLHNNYLVVGLSNGVIIYSSDANNFQQIVPSISQGSTVRPAITALRTFANNLWVGTASVDSKSFIHVVTINSTGGFVSGFERRVFSGYSVACLEVVGSRLFVGTASLSEGQKRGYVHMYFQDQWSLSLTSDQDSVQVLRYFPAAERLYAGMNGGFIRNLAFDSNGAPTAWSSAISKAGINNFTQCVAGLGGNFLWFLHDGGVLLYTRPRDRYDNLPMPKNYTHGVLARWTESDEDTYTQIATGGTQTDQVEDNINWTDLVNEHPEFLDTIEYTNARWKGWVRADFTGEYRFYLPAEDGASMTLGGTLIATSNSPSNAIRMLAGQWVPFTVDYYKGELTLEGEAYVKLEWSCTVGGSEVLARQVVPKFNLAPLPSYNHTGSQPATSGNALARALVYLEGVPFFGADNGRLYQFDASSYITTTRTAYLRLKDNASRATPVEAPIKDVIVQDAERLGDGTRQATGKIYHVDGTASEDEVKDIYSPVFKGVTCAPDRRLLQYGVYDSIGFFVGGITRWNTLYLKYFLPTVGDRSGGLYSGTEIKVYVRSADKYNDLLLTEWRLLDLPLLSAINANSYNLTEVTYDISFLQYTWFQYRLVLGTAAINTSPEAWQVQLSFSKQNTSYFFTDLIDTGKFSNINPSPRIRRGILTANYLENYGSLSFGYTTENDPSSTYNFSKYTLVDPEKVFELETPSQFLRFGVMFKSVDPANPAQLDDLAVMIEPNEHNLRLMNRYSPSKNEACFLWCDSGRVVGVIPGGACLELPNMMDTTLAPRLFGLAEDTNHSPRMQLNNSPFAPQPSLAFTYDSDAEVQSFFTYQDFYNQFSSQELTLFVVFSTNVVTSTYKTLLDSEEEDILGCAVNSTALKVAVGGIAHTCEMPVATPFLSNKRYLLTLLVKPSGDNTITTARINGQQIPNALSKSTGPMDVTSRADTKWFLGKNEHSLGAFGWDGSIAEVVAFNEAFDIEDDIPQVEQYLMDKYGIGLLS